MAPPKRPCVWGVCLSSAPLFRYTLRPFFWSLEAMCIVRTGAGGCRGHQVCHHGWQTHLAVLWRGAPSDCQSRLWEFSVPPPSATQGCRHKQSSVVLRGVWWQAWWMCASFQRYLSSWTCSSTTSSRCVRPDAPYAWTSGQACSMVWACSTDGTMPAAQLPDPARSAVLSCVSAHCTGHLCMLPRWLHCIWPPDATPGAAHSCMAHEELHRVWRANPSPPSLRTAPAPLCWACAG